MGCVCTQNSGMSPDLAKIDKVYEKIIKQQLADHKVTLFTLSNCQKSTAVKAIFKSAGIDFEYFDLDKIPDGKQFCNILQKITKSKSVPYFFYNQAYVGGAQEVEEFVKKIEEKNEEIL